MLAQTGFTVLTFMLVIYVMGALLGVVLAVVCAVQKKMAQALKTTLYLMLLTLSTIMSAAPFLRMHGSYHDGEKLGIILFCLLNIIFIIVFVITRIKALNANHTPNPPA